MDFPHLRRFLKKEGYTYKKEGNTHFLKTRNLLIKKEGKKKEIYLPEKNQMVGYTRHKNIL